MALILPCLVAWYLLASTKGAKAVKSGLPRKIKDAPASLAARHIRARWIGIATAIATFAGLIALYVLVLHDSFWVLDSPTGARDDPYEQGRMLGESASLISLWMFSVGYGLSRLYHRLRFGPATPLLQPSTPLPRL
jgi:hypothetical protein